MGNYVEIGIELYVIVIDTVEDQALEQRKSDRKADW